MNKSITTRQVAAVVATSQIGRCVNWFII